MKIKNQQGIAHILLVILLLVGLVVGVYLVQTKQIFKSKASAGRITFTSAAGSPLPASSGLPVTDSLTVKVTLDPPSVDER